jgi:iron complex outermembrane recepter protein
MNRSLSAATVFLGGFLAQTHGAYAQEATARGLEEIVVTATRREQGLSDVPATVSAFTGSQLNELGVSQTSDIGLLTPNLSISGSFGGSSNPLITIRGVGLSDFNDNNASPAGVYVDEVYFVSPPMLAFSMFDVERVEILKGPQGTLYGRNTTAGAVNFISRRPTDSFTAGLRIEAERYDRVLTEGYVSGPLGPTVSARLAAISETGGDYIENRVTGNDVAGRDYGAARTLLAWMPSQSVEVLLNVHGGRDRSDLGQYQHAGLIDALSGDICPATRVGRMDPECADVFGYSDADGNIYAGDYNKDGGVDYDNAGASIRADWDFGDLVLTSITAYEQFGGVRREESDASPNQLLEIDYDVDVEQVSQEFRLAFTSGAADWIIGAYYGDDQIDVTNTYDILRDLRPVLAARPGVAPSGFLPVGFDPSGVSAAKLGNTYRQDTTASAGFGHVIWSFAEGWNSQAGVRYTREDRSFHTLNAYLEDPVELADYGLATDGSFLDETRSIDKSDLSWTLGLSYKPHAAALYYASASRGFKSGGFNGGIPASPEEVVPYDEEILLAYEIGAKFTVAERHAQLDMSAFYYDYTDLQVFTVINTGTAPVQILTNAADAQIYGLDAEAVLNPTQGLDLRLGLGLLSTEYVNADIGGRDRSGETLVNAPEVSFNGSVRYEHAVADFGLASFLLSTRYKSRQLIENEIVPVHQGGYWITDLRVALGARDARWEVALFAKNLFDKQPLIGSLTLSDYGFAEITYGQPRRYGISLNLRY